MIVFGRFSISVKRHHDHDSFYSGRMFNWGDLQFGGSVYYHHGGVQPDMMLVLETESLVSLVWLEHV